MTTLEVKSLKSGIYRIHWKGKGDTSVAAIGVCGDGTKWLAPTNWIVPCLDGSYWRKVKKVEKIIIV